MTAVDVKFSLERAAQEQPRSSLYPTLHLISHVEILDRTTVNVVTHRPDPQLPARLSSRGGMILPRDYFEEVGMEHFSRRPIGTGPLKFVAWLADATIIFETNQRYWRSPAPFTRVIFKTYPDATTRAAALLAGQVDLITDVPPDHIKVIDNSGVATVVSALSTDLYRYPMNVSQAPLDKRLVRQALHLAIDRQAIVQQLWQGRGAVPRDLSPEHRRDGVELDAPRFRFAPQKARELLAQAGYHGEEIPIEAAKESPPPARELTEALATMFRRVGINARVYWLEAFEYVETFQGVFLSALTSFPLDSDNLWERVLPPGGLYDYWRHPTWDSLMDEVRSLHNQAARRIRYQQAAKLFWEEVPVIIVLQPDHIFGLRKDLRWREHGDGIVMVADFGAGVAPLSE
jgi:peptide/nickel transport system substrate-binding protein